MSYKRVLWHANDTKEGQLIRLAMLAKGLTFLINTDATEGEPTLVDSGTKVIGLCPIIEFLNDKYPEPSLIFTDPSQKAIVRMFVQRLVFGGAYQEIEIADNALAELAPQLNGRFLLGDKPSLLDLAVIPLINESNTLWAPFKTKVMEAIA